MDRWFVQNSLHLSLIGWAFIGFAIIIYLSFAPAEAYSPRPRPLSAPQALSVVAFALALRAEQLASSVRHWASCAVVVRHPYSELCCLVASCPLCLRCS